MLEDPRSVGAEISWDKPESWCVNLFGIGGEMARERVDLLGPAFKGAFHDKASTRGTRPWLLATASTGVAEHCTVTVGPGGGLNTLCTPLAAKADCKSLPQKVFLLRNGDSDARPFTDIIAVAIVPELFLPGTVALPRDAGDGDGGGGGGARTELSVAAFA